MYVLIVLSTCYLVGFSLIASRRSPIDPEDQLTARVNELVNAWRLSPREADVLALIARDRTVSQIAEQLVVSVDTVKTHRKRIYQKANIHSAGKLLELIRRK